MYALADRAPDPAEELDALRRTVAVLKERVESLQNRRSDNFAVFESMAHMEALVAERTDELNRAKGEIEQVVAQRTAALTAKADELERANATLQEMDRMKTHLLQNVSHELKTPLVSIRGYAELLRYRYADNLNEDQLQFLDTVIRNADHLNRVIEDLVQASQLARGMSPFESNTFDINDVVIEVLEEMQPFAATRGVALKHMSTSGAVMIEGDRRQVRQMILNILSNGIKFTEGCESAEVQVDLRQEDPDVILEITDSGVGIPKENISRIFDRFYQVDPSATRRYGGMGIGLALVHEVVENHQGTVFVESKPGRGTRFVVRLPIRQDDGLVAEAGRRTDQKESVDICIVEDQEESALFYQTALTEFGYSIAMFTSPQNALDRWSQIRARVVLLDLSMPEMSGMDFIENLKSIADKGEIQMPQIVLITARSPDELAGLTFAADVHSILYKPFSLSSLSTILGELFSGKSDESGAKLA